MYLSILLPRYQDIINEKSNGADEFNQNLSKEYIDKLFISGVKLGELSIDERKAIFREITKDKVGDVATEKKQEAEKETVAPAPRDLRVEQGVSWSVDLTDLEAVDRIEGSVKYDIGPDEFEMLYNFVSKYAECTPRSIRIFYYRYLLAKRIMKYKFKKALCFTLPGTVQK